MKIKVISAAVLLALSATSFAKEVTQDDIAKVQNGTAEKSENTGGLAIVDKLTFPRAAVNVTGASGSDFKLKQENIAKIKRSAIGFYNQLFGANGSKKYLVQQFNYAMNSGRFKNEYDYLLALATAATESSLDPNAGNTHHHCKGGETYAAFKTNAVGCKGILAQSGLYLEDLYINVRPAKTIITHLNDRLDIPKAVSAYGIFMNYRAQQLIKGCPDYKNGWVEPNGTPVDNVVNKLRTYNGGSCMIYRTNKDKYKTQDDGSKKLLKATPENFEYPYKIGFYYYVFGGNHNYFKELFEGNDSALVSRGMGGTGSFNIPTTGESNSTVPYSVPPQQCGADYKSPLEQKLVVSGTYGKRYDLNKQSMRNKNSVDFLAPIDTPVLSMSDGVIIGVDKSAEYGNVLLVKNESNGSVFGYGSIKDVVLNVGQTVKKGDKLALIADTNADKSPQLMLMYFPNGSGDLSLSEGNTNHEDPLAVYCGEVDIPKEMFSNVGALSQMVTDTVQEQANSLSGAIESMIENRLMNKQWLIDISKMSEPRLYAELAYMKAISLKQDQMLSSIKERTNSIMATQLSLTNDDVLGKEAAIMKSLINH